MAVTGRTMAIFLAAWLLCYPGNPVDSADIGTSAVDGRPTKFADQPLSDRLVDCAASVDCESRSTKLMRSDNRNRISSTGQL